MNREEKESENNDEPEEVTDSEDKGEEINGIYVEQGFMSVKKWSYLSYLLLVPTLLTICEM